MKREKQKYNPSVTNGWKRFGAYLADVVFFIIISFTLYSFALFPLTKVITKYDEYTLNANQAYEDTKKMTKDSKLLLYDADGSELPLTNTFSTDLTYFLDEDFKDEEGKYKEHFAYFYIEYMSKEVTVNNEKPNYNIAWVNQNVFLNNDETNLLFEVASTDEIVHLKADAKTNLTAYKQNDITAKSQEYYDAFINMMQKSWDSASNALISTDQYTVYSDIYKNNTSKMMYIYTFSSIITYTVLFFLYYLLVPALFKQRQTFAKKILGIGVFDNMNKPINIKTLIFRSILLYIFNFYLVMFIPFFILGPDVLVMPLFSIGGTIFYLFTLALVTFAFAIASSVVMGTNINHQSIHDLILKTYVLIENPNEIDPATGEAKVFEEDKQWK